MAEKAEVSKSKFGRRCPLCRRMYHRIEDRWTFNNNYYQDKGMLYYQPPRDIARITWNGYKYFPNEMMEYAQNRWKFILSIALRVIL